MTRSQLSVVLVLLASVGLASGPARAAGAGPRPPIPVKPGDDLVAIVNGGSPGDTFVLEAGTYDLGTASLSPKWSMRIVGVPVVRGPLGEVDAASRIVGHGVQGVFWFTRDAPDVVLENLDISGAPGVKDDLDGSTKQQGRGINGNAGRALRLTVLACNIHDNANTGIGGAGAGLLVSGCEIANNGSESYLGCCAGGVKSSGPMTVEDSYVHDNVGAGIWQDVCGDDLLVVRNRVTWNTQGGIRYEHGSDCPGGATISENVVQNNNTSGEGGHGGIEINSAPDAEVSYNVLGGNASAGIRIYGSRGPVTGTYVHGNDLGGDEIWGCDLPGVTCEP